MDQTLPEMSVATSQNIPFWKKKFFLILLIPFFLIAYSLLVFYLADFFVTKKSEVQKRTPSTQRAVSEANLPIGLQILQNPMVYQWRGSVEGTLTKKDKNSITLSKDEAIITISVDETVPFFDPRKGRTEKGLEPAFLDDIPVGVYLRGEFFTAPTFVDKNSIFGSSFEVVVEKNP